MSALCQEALTEPSLSLTGESLVSRIDFFLLLQLNLSTLPCFLPQALVTGYWLLVTGYWLLVTGYWLLVTGYWLLVTGYWLLEYSPPYK